MAQEMLEVKESAHTLILTDIIEPPLLSNARTSNQMQCINADLCTESSSVVTKDVDDAYVFHCVMTLGAEVDFDLGMKANFDTTRALLERMRNTCPGVRVIYASSQAIYNNSVTLPATESQMLTPETSYGAEKIICEYLITEYTRRGSVDGMSLRFPKVTVRPGKPTAAVISFIGGMIREPLNGIKCVIPIEDKQWRHWLCSPRVLVQNLVYADTELDMNHLAKLERSLDFPSIRVSVQDMIASLARVVGEDKLDLLEMKEVHALKTILNSWSAYFDNKKAMDLGFSGDIGFHKLVKDYTKTLASNTNGSSKNTKSQKLSAVTVDAVEVSSELSNTCITRTTAALRCP
jgi:nucleoside-diphosphate-sugar epimerase